jgi:hypothetical protein
MVATTTTRMFGKSVKATLQNSPPKTMEIALIRTLVIIVMVNTGWRSLHKVPMFPEKVGEIVPMCSLVFNRPLNKALMTSSAVKIVG